MTGDERLVASSSEPLILLYSVDDTGEEILLGWTTTRRFVIVDAQQMAMERITPSPESSMALPVQLQRLHYALREIGI